MVKMWAKVINDRTKTCEVGLGTNESYYKSIGYKQMEVMKGVDGKWYLKGYEIGVPTKSMKLKRIDELKALLASYDYIGVKIATGCATIEDYKDIIEQCEEYRKEIRKLTEATNGNS